MASAQPGTRMRNRPDNPFTSEDFPVPEHLWIANHFAFERDANAAKPSSSSYYREKSLFIALGIEGRGPSDDKHDGLSF